MKEQNFAKLFRRSKFANFDPTIPRIYTPSPSSLPYPSLDPQRNDTSLDVRPQFWGFKRDLPPRHYGRPLKFAQLFALDGDYGLCELRNGARDAQLGRIMNELQRLARYTNTVGSQIAPEELRIPGRILNRIDDGYAIGVAGIVAHLPEAEIPPLQHFTMSDTVNRRAFYFYVKRAEWDDQGRPEVILSLRSPPHHHH